MLTQIIQFYYLTSKEENWAKENAELIESVTKSSNNYFENLILLHKNKSQEFISLISKIERVDFKIIDSLLSEFNTQNISISLIDKKDSLIYWNENYLNNIWEKENWKYSNGEVHFIETEINSCLVFRDTISIGDSKLKFLFAEIVEKQFKLNDDYFTKISLQDKLTEKFGLNCKVFYNPSKLAKRDGRFFNVEIKSNFGNAIGTVEYQKPTKSHILDKRKNFFSHISNSLLLLAYFLIGLLLYKYNILDFNKISNLTFFILYLALLRYLLLFTDFPNYLFSGALLTTEYYHSNFGYGIANTPIQLTITLIFALFISVGLFYYQSKDGAKLLFNNKVFVIIRIIVSLALFVFLVRGIGAAIRGIVFDSSIRYFTAASFNITPQHLLMQFNVLILGLICVSLSITFFVTVFKSFSQFLHSKKYSFIISFLLFIIAEIIFIISQENPQLNLFIKSFLIISSATTFLFVLEKKKNIFLKFVIIFFLGSIFSISALLFYNTELEKNSLKATATIISRYDDSWYKTLIKETLLSDLTINEARLAFEDPFNNFNASAFKIWSRSQLQKEAINSSVNFFDLSGQLLGGFGSVYPKLSLSTLFNTSEVIEEIQIFEEPTDNYGEKLIRGIFPIKDNYSFLGYVDISILSSLDNFGFSSHPDFISTGKLNEKAILKLDKFIILDYHDSQLKAIYGLINPSQLINKKILESNFTRKNDKWMSIPINGANYLFYILKTEHNNFQRVLAVALKDKELSISLFDFFKVFFSHSIILLLILITYFLYYILTVKVFKINLRTKLILVFLIISVIPLVLTAIFFRNLTETKNYGAIYYKLGKRSFNVEKYLNDNMMDVLDFDILNKASRDLNINYSLFSGNKLIYSSQDLLYDVGLLSNLINPKAYIKLIIENAEEILISEKIDKYELKSFYYKANIQGENFIIKITDGFNKIILPLSGSEVDVFLFGFYSLAVVLIIFFSLIFANQISSPIRKITNATKSVAAGDLSLEINVNASGELAELESGFNYMIKELKRNQTMLAEIEREEAWKEMAKQVAHEIKNPLTPMKLSVQQLIAAYEDNSDKFALFFKKVTNTILNQIETLRNIATEFSNFARMPKLKVVNIDFLATVNSAIDLFSNQSIKILKQNFRNNLFIEGDAEQLKRSIINLIRNSIQAGATIVELIFNEDKKSVNLIIKDNGKGIPKEIMDKIFEPNFTTKIEGMGLGLSLVRRYVNSVGGEVQILNTSKSGTTIQLTFPK